MGGGRSGLTGVVDVASGTPVTNRQVALLSASRRAPRAGGFGDLPYRPGDPMFVCADTHHLFEDTGWRPRHDTDSGLRDTTAWWREHLNAGE